MLGDNLHENTKFIARNYKKGNPANVINFSVEQKLQGKYYLIKYIFEVHHHVSGVIQCNPLMMTEFIISIPSIIE